MTELDAASSSSHADDLEALGRARHRPGRWLRRNAWVPLGAAAIMVVLIATTQLVLAVASRKDDLRQAQIAIAAAGQTEFALMHAPIGLIAGQVAGADEYTLNATLRAKLSSQMASLALHWPTSVSRQVRAEATDLAGRTVTLYELIRQHRLRAAGQLYDRTISPLSDSFNAKLELSQNRLDADTNGADQRALVAALGVAAGAGVLLMLLLFSVAAVRRRLENAETVERVLSALATTDSLTGVPNHRALGLTIRTELERARRYERPFALLFLDIDHFKQVNDRNGHAAGDTVLSAFAGVVNETLRRSDVFGRWGGEEFLAVLPETDPATALETAERIRAAVEQYEFFSPDRGEQLTCSIGVANWPDDARDVVGLIGAADDAMYAAKAGGRNRCATCESRLAR
jgi:diguanylate cyclase (GGDEF)-like protein